MKRLDRDLGLNLSLRKTATSDDSRTMDGAEIEERTLAEAIAVADLVIVDRNAPRFTVRYLEAHAKSSERIRVIRESRVAERRSGSERRRSPVSPAAGRRLIRAANGRRIADRRVPLVEVPTPATSSQSDRCRLPGARFVRVRRQSPVELEDIETARLVLKVQTGDDEAIAVIHARYYDRIHALATRILGDWAEAEDVAQQVSMRMLTAIQTYDLGERPFRAWLFTVARNEALTKIRKAGRLSYQDPGHLAQRIDELGIGDSEHEPFDARGLMRWVGSLPHLQRQVLFLRFHAGLEAREAAGLLGISVGNFRILQHRALTFLRQRVVEPSALGARGEPAVFTGGRLKGVTQRKHRALTE